MESSWPRCRAEWGLEPAQSSLLGEVIEALLGRRVDMAAVDHLDPSRLGVAPRGRSAGFRHRIVHLMVLGELILRPIPPDVACPVSTYADALGVDDESVRVARRYAQGALRTTAPSPITTR